MTYFSQAGEDRWMIENHLGDYPPAKRLYFEAGALDGRTYSNTLALEQSHNWTGILVEPDPLSFEELKRNRSNNVLYNCLCSDKTEEIEFQYFPNSHLAAVSAVKETMLAGLKKTFYDSANASEWILRQQQDLQTILMKPRSLSEILRSSGFQHIGFASLDVEGHEMNVLRSHDFTFPIEYFLIENNETNQIRDIMHRNGYRMIESISHNLLFHRNME